MMAVAPSTHPNLASLYSEINAPLSAPSGFQLRPDIARHDLPHMNTSVHAKTQLGEIQNSLVVGQHRSHLQSLAPNGNINGTTTQNPFAAAIGQQVGNTTIGKTLMNGTTAQSPISLLSATEHIEDLPYWNPLSMQEGFISQMMASGQWGHESTLAQQMSYMSPTHDFANAIMTATLREDVPLDTQGAHLQNLAYWNDMQLYGQDAPPAHPPYYPNASQFPSTPLPEMKVHLCVCGKAFSDAANFCANCGAKRPAGGEGEEDVHNSSEKPAIASEGRKDSSEHVIMAKEPTMDNEGCESSDRALSDDIAAQVARYLQGDGCDSDDDVEEDDTIAEDIGKAESTTHEATSNLTKASALLQETTQTSTTSRLEMDRQRHPSFMRGSRFSETFRHVPLNLDGQDLGLVADTIASCVEDLCRRNSRPLVRSVQRLLYMRGMAKRVVQCVLGICVNFPKRFEIWLPLDMQPCILLPCTSLDEAKVLLEEDVALEGNRMGRYEYDFLMELASWVHKSLVPQALHEHQLMEPDSDTKSDNPKTSKQAPSSKQSDTKTNNIYPNASVQAPASKQSDIKATDDVRNVTTLMLRNLPPSLTNAELEKEIKNSGFEGAYDFIHCPRKINEGVGTGYGFVNFVNTVLAYKFASEWHGTKRFPEAECQLCAINVSAAEHQGLEANLKGWSGSRLNRVKNPKLRPIVKVEENHNLSELSHGAETIAYRHR